MKICKFLSGSDYSEKEIYCIKLCTSLEQNCVCIQQVNTTICRLPPHPHPPNKIEIFQIFCSYVWMCGQTASNWKKKLQKICFKTHYQRKIKRSEGTFILYDYKPCCEVIITWIAMLVFLSTYRAAVAVQLTTVTVVAGWGVKDWTL